MQNIQIVFFGKGTAIVNQLSNSQQLIICGDFNYFQKYQKFVNFFDKLKASLNYERMNSSISQNQLQSSISNKEMEKYLIGSLMMIKIMYRKRNIHQLHRNIRQIIKH
ncbi:unnamed protein product [Paramecium octaurelia]|uniref:Uncharacterized protein n=1 Tax=Paramecium octaurelia TaxID=43137 RepID=A0A8S1VS22_PAROT|nr:unnamed protein product [Paramecium octaurelia]